MVATFQYSWWHHGQCSVGSVILVFIFWSYCFSVDTAQPDVNVCFVVTRCVQIHCTVFNGDGHVQVAQDTEA